MTICRASFLMPPAPFAATHIQKSLL